MQSYRIILDFSIMLYCIITGTKDNSVSFDKLIVYLLIYINLKMLVYLFSEKKTKLVLSFFCLIFICIVSKEVNEIFILMIPPITCLIFEKIRKSNFLLIIFLSCFIFIISSEFINIFVFVSIISMLIYSMSFNEDKKIKELILENDSLRQDNFELINKIYKEKAYIKEVNYSAILEERNKIAQKIHDNIGHTIAGSLMHLEAAKLIISDSSPKAMIENTINNLREGMNDIRCTLKNIKPTEEEVGINKIKLELNKFTSSTNIKSKFIFDCDLDDISFSKWRIINENLKEALTNTLKYAKASEVSVKIKKFNKFIRVEFKDNGLGVGNIKKGMGLRGIEERTESIGGKIILSKEDGFSIIMILPL
ncbi:sensor histidine kinase [Haloimpatiens sp. FM7315]|uniref:sensor histidine kinase n=1 Tax=Haloimpatiens sp. FM7315 TaxID=3298609 RepID=UPI00370A899A